MLLIQSVIQREIFFHFKCITNLSSFLELKEETKNELVRHLTTLTSSTLRKSSIAGEDEEDKIDEEKPAEETKQEKPAEETKQEKPVEESAEVGSGGEVGRKSFNSDDSEEVPASGEVPLRTLFNTAAAEVYKLLEMEFPKFLTSEQFLALKASSLSNIFKKT